MSRTKTDGPETCDGQHDFKLQERQQEYELIFVIKKVQRLSSLSRSWIEVRLIFGMDLRTWTQTLGQQSEWMPAVDHKTIFHYSDILTSDRHNKTALSEPAGLNSHYGDANGGAEENRQPRVRINHNDNSLNGFPVVG